MFDRRRRRDRATTGAWQDALAAVSLEDAATAAALAREVATPFGFKRPARELLARFGGDTPDGRRRAIAALAVSGIAADPPLDTVKPHQWVQLRQREAEVQAPEPASSEEPAAVAAAPDPDTPPTRSRRSLRPADVAARHAPTGPVTRERRFAAGAIGLGALLVLLLAVVVLRGTIGGGEDTKGVLPTATAAAEVETSTTPAPPPAATTPDRPAAAASAAASPRRSAETASAAPSRSAAATAPAASRRPAIASAPQRTVRLRIVPTEPSYICVADGRTGEKLWEGMRTGPYTVRRTSLFLRIGVATARIAVDGRPLTVDVAPSTYALTAAGVRPAAGRSACAG